MMLIIGKIEENVCINGEMYTLLGKVLVEYPGSLVMP